MKDRIAQEKENKIFKKWDIVIYSILALLIIGLFLGVFLTRDKDQISSFTITYDNVQVLEYDFDNDSIIYAPEYISFEKKESAYIITFKEGKDSNDYNTFYVDLTKRQITCSEANCSLSKDCTHMKIEKMGDTIICVPHRLIVSPKGKGEIVDPVIG